MSHADRIEALERRIEALELAMAKRGKRKMPTRNAAEPTRFAEAWDLYPKRTGGNSRHMALKSYTARINEGVTEDKLVDGVTRYRRFCEATERVGTQFVLMACTFFGPSRRYEEDWALPSAPRDELDDLLDEVERRG